LRFWLVGSWHPFLPKALKMGQRSVSETLVAHQKLTPGYNPKTFKQHDDHGGSLQLHITPALFVYEGVHLKA
jgi:hypothetical protein